MTFGEAIEALKEGFLVTRTGWNGKDMFLWLKPATVIKEEWCKDPILLQICQDNGGQVEALGTICMKTADNKVLTGWLASQTDMLSTDWEYYTPNYAKELTEKDFDFDYKAFVEKQRPDWHEQQVHDVERTRDIMGVGTSEEEKAATHEKIASTTNTLSARIQHDVLNLINEGGLDNNKRVERLTALKESFLSETEDEGERQFIEEQFGMFLEYVANL